jgi:alanine racemase
MSAPVFAEISLTALGHNIRHLASTIAPTRLMVVVKANAYGHGSLAAAQEAVRQGMTDLAALDLDTALILRRGGIPHAVRVLSWLYSPGTDFREAVRHRVDLGVSRLSEIAGIIDAVHAVRAEDGSGVVAHLHLKLDTGLRRNGATEAEWPALVAAVVEAQREGVVRAVAAWTHIAEASDDEDTVALRRFEHGIAQAAEWGLPGLERHLAASSAGLRRSDVRLDMVRMGGHCWGIPSFDGVTPEDIGLTPVMTLRSVVVGTRHDHPQWGGVGYVSAGYGDGVPRAVAGEVSVAVDGQLTPVLDVHRDYLIVADPTARLRTGNEAVLFGTGRQGEQTVRQWGDATGTLGDEITARISARVPRVYVN